VREDDVLEVFNSFAVTPIYLLARDPGLLSADESADMVEGKDFRALGV
jgi:hypothetical protein